MPANRPEPGPHPRPGPRPDNPVLRQDLSRYDWYHGDWHGHWDHPWNRWPYGWFDAGVVWGVAGITPWSWGYCSYYNPYRIAPVVINGVTIDYSQPIAAAVPPEPLVGQGLAADEASRLLDAARDAFLRGNYREALNDANRAISKNPGDPLPHQFRSLVCFALKQYKEAAAGAYAVLSAGPGWDWTTLSSFYLDTNIYALQLRALEQYVDAHRDQPDARFLLAYHYLTCGHADAAAQQLKAIVQLNPKDQLSAQLLASLTAPPGAEPPGPVAPAAPARPVDAASLVGDWQARQPDGSTILLRLTGDSTYVWRFTRQGQTQEHSGTYALADNMLILKQGDAPAMAGQVTLLGDGRLNFKLANGNPADPGLTFSK
jgi:tetratricopeptide (TPR) repeat protein